MKKNLPFILIFLITCSGPFNNASSISYKELLKLTAYTGQIILELPPLIIGIRAFLGRVNHEVNNEHKLLRLAILHASCASMCLITKQVFSEIQDLQKQIKKYETTAVKNN